MAEVMENKSAFFKPPIRDTGFFACLPQACPNVCNGLPLAKKYTVIKIVNNRRYILIFVYG
jgi:hypothetical protein